MTYSTVLEDLKTLVDAGSYGTITFTTKIFSETDYQNEPEILAPWLYPVATLTTNKTLGIFMPDIDVNVRTRTHGADKWVISGTLSIFAKSAANLKDTMEDVIQVGEDQTASTLRFAEAPILYDGENSIYWCNMKYTWRKEVTH